MNEVTAFIENNLTNELNPETVANRHFVSLSQLYRDFYSYTGHSIKEYIRKRRISNACERLKCSDMPLDVITAESGYQTQQAFHKQFRELVNMTPLEYRKSDTWFYFYPFDTNDISLAVKVGAEVFPACEARHFYDSCLAGIEDRAIESLGEVKGRVFGRNGKQIGNRFCYEVMTEKENALGKTGTYAVCTVKYNEREIGDGWNYLYNVWLSGSMFEQAEEGYFEEYLFKDGKPYKLKLYLPVKKRGTAGHITITQEPEKVFLIAREAGRDAERKASEKVMGFLQERYPLTVRNSKRFYVSARGDVWACGVECGDGFKLPENDRVELLRIPAGTYAVLPDDCLGDIGVGAAKLERWLQNNSVAHVDEPIFAVYETQNGRYDTDSVRMNLYKRLK
ncbi:MAG TPA: helix-turn-helix domain-containing protein [Clostridiales bacterium]|nr:helix-turn-helix domain-containing protein [Clostridiales bacterium]